MNIKTIEDAKKYIGKKLYSASNHNLKPGAKNKVYPLYIGGVHLFYNQVNYDITGFAVYEDVECTNYYGEIKLDAIAKTFDSVNNRSKYYFLSKEEAGKYCIWLNADDKERERDRDVATAKELLNDHSIKFEIFE